MKNQTLNIIIAKLRLGLVALALVSFVLVGSIPVGSAQSGSGSPPPTYDYDNTPPGVQGPTSPLLATSDARFFRTLTVLIPVRVPLAELQAALPPGFTATANPAGSDTAQVALTFIFQEQHTQLADGLTVRGSGMFATTIVMNTNLMPNRQEVFLFNRETSIQESVDYLNARFGPGSTGLAKVTMQVTEEGENLSFKANVTDDGHGLNISAQATCPGPIVNRVKNDPQASIFRILTSNRSWWGANQNDSLVVPQAMANGKVETPDGKFPVGVAGGGSRSLTILGIGANITFNRNSEGFQTKPE